MRNLRFLNVLMSSLALWGLTFPSAGGLSAQGRVPTAEDDGPYVYWGTGSSAIVFYSCDGDLQQQPFNEGRARGIQGFCGDTGAEYLLTPMAPDVAPDTFRDVSRIFAVSDVHGEYDALTGLLVKAGVVDQSLAWSWGKGHLVILGDVFDRGNRVTECLWLIHRLEREAEEAGGRVHYLLGNDDIMVLQEDLRYVNEKYMDGIVSESGIRYDDLFGPAMQLGRWLRTKHLAVRLNGILYVHGGLGPQVVARNLKIKDINAQGREGIDLRTYDRVFKDLPNFIFGSEGPLWYRGYHRSMDYAQATDADIQTVLSHFGATAVVVGHTDIGEIRPLYGGRVFGIDVDVATLGSLQGLLWEGGEFFKVVGDGRRDLIRRGEAEGGEGS